MANVYNVFDIVGSISAYGEGFSNVIGGAMVCSVPYVVTDVGDSAVIVGDTGYVIPPHGKAELIQAWKEMIKKLNTDSQVLKSLVRNRILERFSVGVCANATLNALWRAL